MGSINRYKKMKNQSDAWWLLRRIVLINIDEFEEYL
jgi:hypothetical protein